MTAGPPEPTPAQEALSEALDDAAAAVLQLQSEGKDDRAGGLAVACDLCVSACFLWGTGDQEYGQAVKVVRDAIAHATRTEDQ